jgi:hypothetical protein
LAEPDTWADWLPLATLVHNNRQNATTTLSPNQILLGYEPLTTHITKNITDNQMTEDRLGQMEEFQKKAVQTLNDAAKQGPVLEARYKLGDKVWLEGTNLKLPYQATKLVAKRYGPFKVIAVISPVAYRLALPLRWQIHDVFHASLLTPYTETSVHGPNFAMPPPDIIEGEAEYEVERIIKHRQFGRTQKRHYLIKWKGYPDSDNTWEPEGNVHAPDLIKQYWQKNKEQIVRAYLSQDVDILSGRGSDVTVPFLAPPESRDTPSPGLPSGLPSNTRDQTARDTSCDWATAKYYSRTACWQGQGQVDTLARICWHLRHGANIRTTRWQDHELAASWHDKNRS